MKKKAHGIEKEDEKKAYCVHDSISKQTDLFLYLSHVEIRMTKFE